jgi:DNA-binding response OmpR family regulator
MATAIISSETSTIGVANMRILLVEDDYSVRTVIAEVLSDAGYDVREAAGPKEALCVPGAIEAPDVLVTDVDLGAPMNGFDIAVEAHRRWPTVQVILISGLPADHTGQTLDSRDRYLQKPFSGTRLLRAIGELVGTTMPARLPADASHYTSADAPFG